MRCLSEVADVLGGERKDGSDRVQNAHDVVIAVPCLWWNGNGKEDAPDMSSCGGATPLLFVDIEEGRDDWSEQVLFDQR